MANNLPTYGQGGWGSGLNNYLARLNSNILSLQKEMDSIKGEAGVTLTKYAGSGFTNSGMKLSYKIIKNGGESVEFVTTLLEIYNNKFKEGSTDLTVNLINNNFALTGGSLFLSASLYYSTGRLYKIDNSNCPEFTFKRIFNIPASVKESSYFDRVQAGTYAVALKEQFYNGVAKLEPILLKSTEEDSATGNIISTTKLWLDPDLCRLGIVTIYKDNESTRVFFMPAPSICTNTSGAKEHYMLNPSVGQFNNKNETEESVILPNSYEYTLEGGSYFANFSSKNAETIEELVVPSCNLITLETQNNVYLFLDEDYTTDALKRSVRLQSLSKTDIFKTIIGEYGYDVPVSVEQDCLYILYATNNGILFLRKISNGLIIQDARELPLISTENFETYYPTYGNSGSVEVMRFTFSSIMHKFIFYSPIIDYRAPQFSSITSATTWGNLGILPNSGVSNEKTLKHGMYMVPVLGTSDVNYNTIPVTNPNKIIYNLSGLPSGTEGIMAGPKALLYDIINNDVIHIYGTSEGKPEIQLINGDIKTIINNSQIKINNTTLSQSELNISDIVKLNQTSLSMGTDISLTTSNGLKIVTVAKQGEEAEKSITLSKNGLNIEEAISLSNSGLKLGSAITLSENEGLLIGSEADTQVKLQKGNLSLGSSFIVSDTEIKTSLPINFTSDRRYKENIKHYDTKVLELIDDLPIYTYNIIGQKNNTIGVMAQDLIKIAPNLVHYTKDEIRNDKMVIEEGKIIFLCLKAIQELKKELCDLKRSLNIYD